MDSNNNFSFQNLSLDDLKNIMVKIYKGSNYNEVAQATQFLRAYAKTLESVPTFVQILTQDSVSELRLLSAIILKKHIAPHLLTMDQQDSNLLKKGLLDRFFEEPQKRVQKSLAVLISTVLKVACEHNQNWIDPIVTISQKTKPDQPEPVRIQGFLLLTTILEITGAYLSSFYEELFKFFLETIQDKSPIIRKQTLLCVLNMFTSVDQEELLVGFDQIYPLLLECFYQSLQDKDEDTIENVLEMFDTLTKNKNALFDNDKLSKLIHVLCTDVGLLSKELNSLFKETMIDILGNIIGSSKSVISKDEDMLKKITEVIFTLACIKESKEEIQDRDSLQDVALYFIQEAGILLPKKKSYGIFKDYLLKMFQSNNETIIEAAFLILGHLSEGCCEYIKRDLEILMKNYVQTGLENANSEIKKAAFQTINFFAKFLSPEIIEYHSTILPPLIRNLNDTSDQKILTGNIISLELFCQEMDESIIDYLNEIIPRLIQIVDNAGNSMTVKHHSIFTIASCAEVAKEKFAPYAAEILPLVAQLINITEPTLLGLRAAATKCIANILEHCLAGSSDVFARHVEPIIPAVYEGLKTVESAIVKEYSFEFFYKLASYLQRGFTVYLERILEIIFTTLENAQVSELKKKEPQIISLADNDDDEDLSDDEGDLCLDEDLMEEIAAAVRCLGEMALVCPSEFTPFYEKTNQALAYFSQHTYYNVRMQSLISYKNITKAIVKLENNGELPAFRTGLPCAQRLTSDAEKFLYVDVYEKLFNTLEIDDHIQLLAATAQIIYDFCIELGPAAVDQRLERITEYLIKIFTNQTNAQIMAFEEEDDVHGEVFGGAILLIHGLIKACGEGFFLYFDKLYPYLKKFTSEDTAEDDVAEAMGCFGQALKYMPSTSNLYGADLLQICYKTSEYGDEYLNRNIANCLGLLVETGKEKFFDQYGTILGKLREIYENSTFPSAKDNALGAIAKMVYTNPSQIPIKVIVPGMIKEMPLKGDVKEERTLISMLIFLFETNVEVLNGLEEKCIELLIDAVIQRKTYKIKNENVIRAIGTILKNLSENQGAKQIIQNCASRLSQANVDILTQLLSGQY